jgi:hypothetical protein
MFIDQTGWMLHVWAAPGWSTPGDVFAMENPRLGHRE